jgi:AraC-like DNA-binding protein
LYNDYSEGLGSWSVCGWLNACVLITRKCQEALGADWYPKTIGIAVPLSDIQRFAPEFARSTICHGCGSNYIELKRSDLEACFPKSLGAADILSVLGETEMDAVPGSLIEIVGEHLSFSLESDKISIQETARQLNVSVRSLQRRMADEGLSYRGFLNELRYQIALDRLASEDISIGELANQLGYKDPANFTRAFRLRCGTSPRTFRMKHGTSHVTDWPPSVAPVSQ